MKRIIYFLAFLFVLIFVTGFACNLLRLPHASFLLYTGGSGAAIVFPFIFYYLKKEGKLQNKAERAKWISGLVSMSIFTISTWLHFSYKPLANVLLIASFVIFCFAYLPALFFNWYRKSLEKI
jgi:Na+/proline symporter